MRPLLATPEFNVALFAFLLNFPWEFLQVPFFAEMPTMAHWDAVLFCARATLGDVPPQVPTKDLFCRLRLPRGARSIVTRRSSRCSRRISRGPGRCS